MLIYMCMLNKRVHILFDEKEHQLISMLALMENISVGELVRTAVRKQFLDNRLETKNRRQAVDNLLAWQKKIGIFPGINYRELIEYGRTR